MPFSRQQRIVIPFYWQPFHETSSLSEYYSITSEQAHLYTRTQTHYVYDSGRYWCFAILYPFPFGTNIFSSPFSFSFFFLFAVVMENRKKICFSNSLLCLYVSSIDIFFLFFVLFFASILLRLLLNYTFIAACSLRIHNFWFINNLWQWFVYRPSLCLHSEKQRNIHL